MKAYQHRTRQMYINASGRLTNAEREHMNDLQSIWPLLLLLTLIVAALGLNSESKQIHSDDNRIASQTAN